jgi:hypothetical protein
MTTPARRLALAVTPWQADDPVLAALRAARARRDQADRDIRILLAYARELTTPRPYRLADLAEATGKSISGIRTAYTATDIDAARRILHDISDAHDPAEHPQDGSHDLSRPPGRASVWRQEAVDTETALPGRGERRVRRVPPPRHPRLQPPRRRR